MYFWMDVFRKKTNPISIYQLAKCEHYSYHTKCIDFRYWNIKNINNNVCPVLRVCFPIQQWCPFWWFLLNMQFENHFSLPFLRLFLDVCVCMLNHFSCVRLFATLWTAACQASLSMGLSRQEYCSGLPCPPPGNLPDPGIQPSFPRSLVLTGGFSTTSDTWQARLHQASPIQLQRL